MLVKEWTNWINTAGLKTEKKLVALSTFRARFLSAIRETAATSALIRAPKKHKAANKTFVEFLLLRRKEISDRERRTKDPSIGGIT